MNTVTGTNENQQSQENGLHEVASTMNAPTQTSENDLSFLTEHTDAMSQGIKNVKADLMLGLGVFDMKIVGMKQQKFKNKKGDDDSSLVIIIDTGYTKLNSTEPRCFNVSFWYHGKFDDGKNRDEALLSFLKRCFAIEGKISIDTFKNLTGKHLAVATMKDANGFISFWYAGALKDLNAMKNSYKAKDISNGQKPNQTTTIDQDIQAVMNTSNMPPTPPVIDPATGLPVTGKADDLPF